MLRYWYCWGINFRAYAAYICGIAINVVGFAGAVGTPVPMAATHIYQLSFFTGLGVSSTIYYLLNRFFPVPKATLDDTFDDFADHAHEEVRAVEVEAATTPTDKEDLKDDDFYTTTRVEEAI